MTGRILQTSILLLSFVGLVQAQPAVQLKDINPGTGGSSPGPFFPFNGVLFFPADDGTHGQELWKTDGTAAGTTMVLDINPGSAGSNPFWFVQIDTKIYFQANDGINGAELWSTDGTAAGTFLVRDIQPGSGSSFPNQLVNLGSRLLFAANDGTNGNELWLSDGTAAGTTLVDIFPGSSNSSIPFSSSPNGLVRVGSTVFFRAANSSANGNELWRSDGTAAGTSMVRDINPGAQSSALQLLTSCNGLAFFRAVTLTNGQELWKSDGTANGTLLVRDIFSGSNSSGPSELQCVGNQLIFAADNGANGKELWESDGTTAGTVLVKDIRPGATGSIVGFTGHTASINGRYYFRANDGNTGEEPWVSDGTTAGTLPLGDLNPGSSDSLDQVASSNFTGFGEFVFFAANTPTEGVELYRTNGDTFLFQDICPGTCSSNPSHLTLLNPLIFSADDGATGEELWILSDSNLTGGSQKLYFAQFGNGVAGEITLSSDIVLPNPSASETASGTADFFQADGSPFSTGIEGEGTTSRVDFMVAPLDSITIATTGEGDFGTGTAVVSSDLPLGGVIRFEINAPSGVGSGIAGVPASQVVSSFLTPVRRVAGGINTGIAIRNVGSQEVNLSLSLRSEGGIEVASGSAVRSIAADGQLVDFINGLFPNADTGNLVGSLVVTSDGMIAATAIEQGVNPGEFTTLPVTPLE